jgi:hypothetical protein
MTKNDLKALHAGWLATFEIPPGIDERSRRIREDGLVHIRKMKFLDNPSFGSTVATNLGCSGYNISLLEQPTFKWVAASVRFWRSIGHSTGDEQTEVVKLASELSRRNSPRRKYLNAALLVPDATADSVAKAFGLDTPVVEAYTDLYFNVLDRRDSPAYLHAAFKMGVMGEYETKQSHPNKLPWMSRLTRCLGFPGPN